MKLLVTRPQPQADAWVEQLMGLGIDACALPLLGIADAVDPVAVQQAWAELPGQQLVMFVSPNAVGRFFAQAPAAQAWPDAVLAAGTGPGTAAALLSHGVPERQLVCPTADGQSPDSEALWQILQGRADWQGRRALIVRGESGRNWLAERLAERGAAVSFVESYRRIAPTLSALQLHCLQVALQAPRAHVWVLSSSQALTHLAGLGVHPMGLGLRALATHARVAQAAHELGFERVTVVAPSVQAVAAWVTRSIQSA